MFSLRSSQIPQASKMIIAAVVVAGCTGGTSGSTASPSSSSTPPATTAPAETVATPSSGVTADEAKWIAGVVALGKKMLGPTSGEVTITSKYLRAEAKRLSSCGAELAQLGPSPERLQSVVVLAKQACDKYEEGAKCYTAAKSNIDQASKCLVAINKASELFSIAETTAESLKDTVN
jgi:hypothetical protein